MFSLLVFGNSLTEGFGLARGQALPEQLDQALQEKGHGVKVLNGGLSGDTTWGGLRRIGPWLEQEPGGIVLELGINDFILGVPCAQIKSGLEQLIVQCLETTSRLILVGFSAPDLPLAGVGLGQALDFPQLYWELADKYMLPLVPDFLSGVAGNKDLTLTDGLHPNARGVAMLVGRLLPVVLEILPSAAQGATNILATRPEKRR